LNAFTLYLPQEQKEALVLHQFSEMSLEEIARLTGTSVGTVKSRLRCDATLRQQLQDV
jgi:DNA-directed RNA polymerase specialized sigma subunit, sigma24 homolog